MNYEHDINEILSHRYDNGVDLWAAPDNNLTKGGPFTTLECALYLLELGVSYEDPILQDTAELILCTWREDGRFKLSPQGGMYPCKTAAGLHILCHMGYAKDVRIQKTYAYFLETQYESGGWRCNKFSFGRGPETLYANPYPTLLVLDAFRFREDYETIRDLDQAIEFLLEHWIIRKPIGPCHYGIGKLFMQVEYPFRCYNLFQYVYTLSFYDKARKDSRFQEAFLALKGKTVDGQIVVERVVPKLAQLSFCKKNEKSELATRRYHEILHNLGIDK